MKFEDGLQNNPQINNIKFRRQNLPKYHLHSDPDTDGLKTKNLEGIVKSGQHRYEEDRLTQPGPKTNKVNNHIFDVKLPVLAFKTTKISTPKLHTICKSDQWAQTKSKPGSEVLTPIRGRIQKGKVADLRSKFE